MNNLNSCRQSADWTSSFYCMHLTFTAQCGTELDHSEMLRLVRHPIHIFTASPSGSFQHALWALSPLKCCSWHQPAKLACKLAATLKRENNSSSDQNSPQPFHLHARQRVLYRKCLTDNNHAEQWLKTFKNDYNFRSGVLSLLWTAPDWVHEGFEGNKV